MDNITKQEKGNYYDSQKEQNIIEPKIGSICCFSHYDAEMALAILHVYTVHGLYILIKVWMLCNYNIMPLTCICVSQPHHSDQEGRTAV